MHVARTFLAWFLLFAVCVSCKHESKEPPPKKIDVLDTFRLTDELEDDGPCCNVTASQEGLDIIIDGFASGKLTPDRALMQAGQLVYLSSVVEPKTSAFLVGEGEIYQSGAWVLQGDEKFIRFHKEPFEEGVLLHAETGYGAKTIGLDINLPLSQKRFAHLIKGQKMVRLLYLDRRKNLTLAPLLDRSDLWVLDLSHSSFSDLTPIANHKDLRMLRINNSQVADLAPLANMSQLRVLELDETAVGDISALSKMSEMRSLSLRGTPVKSIAALKRMSHLARLDIDDTKVSSLAPLAKLIKLKELYASGIGVRSLAPLSKMTKLERLSLDGTKVADLSLLAKMKKLKTLHLRNTSVSNIKTLAGLENLEELYLDGTKVSDIAPLAGCKNLKKLSLVATEVKDVKGLGDLKNLEWLSVFKSPVLPAQVDWLKGRLPGARVVK